MIASFTLAGKDASSFLQRLISQNIQLVETNRQIPSLMLDANGKVLCLFWLTRIDEGFVITSHQKEIAVLRERLDFYQFSEELFFGETSELSEGQLPWSNKTLPIDTKDFEELRLQAALLWPAADFNESRLVFELGYEKFCSDSKGCYIGQEVVERVRSRGGGSPFRLCVLKTQGQLTESEELFSSGEKVGQVVILPQKPDCCLARVKTKFVETNAELVGKSGQLTNILSYFE